MGSGEAIVKNTYENEVMMKKQTSKEHVNMLSEFNTFHVTDKETAIEALIYAESICASFAAVIMYQGDKIWITFNPNEIEESDKIVVVGESPSDYWQNQMTRFG